MIPSAIDFTLGGALGAAILKKISSPLISADICSRHVSCGNKDDILTAVREIYFRFSSRARHNYDIFGIIISAGGERNLAGEAAFKLHMAFYICLVSGFVSGLLGGMGMGGGTLLIPVLTIFFSVPQKIAQSTNLLAFLPMVRV